jgi:hypothetical protein
MAKIRLARNIQSVKLMVGRIIATTGSGKEVSYPYERLTAAQETKLRSMAAPLPMRQSKPSRSRSASMPRKTFNYAAQVVQMDSILINVGGEFAGVLEA